MEHYPVMAQETLAGLAPRPGAHCIDGTVGLGGHAKALLAASGPDGRLLGLDRDPQALALAQANLAEYGSRAVLVQTRFDAMATVARAHDFAAVDAILLDLGVSSLQLDLADRGFSFRGEGPLDMRMGPDATLTAEEIVNTWPQDRLADVIYQYGEEPLSRRIARAIIAARPLHTTTELAEVVRRASGGRSGGRRAKGHERIHPATRTFQALRIAVNQELAALEAVLPQCVELLQPGGRLAVITFHSLEDRIVKQFIQRESRDCICPPELPVCQCGHVATLRPVNRKPIQAGDAEIEANPRSRSAKLRVAERVGTGHPA